MDVTMKTKTLLKDWTVRKSKYLYPAQKTTYLKTKSSIYYIIRRKNNVNYIIINVIVPIKNRVSRHCYIVLPSYYYYYGHWNWHSRLSLSRISLNLKWAIKT